MTKPVSALRQRMIDDMKIRNMSPNTQYIYTRAVASFSSFHQQSPDKLTIEDVRDYRLHLIARGLKTACRQSSFYGAFVKRSRGAMVAERPGNLIERHVHRIPSFGFLLLFQKCIPNWVFLYVYIKCILLY
jgi:hypothetical protein